MKTFTKPEQVGLFVSIWIIFSIVSAACMLAILGIVVTLIQWTNSLYAPFIIAGFLIGLFPTYRLYIELKEADQQ